MISRTPFGARVQALRKARDLSQEKAAEGIGISRAYLAGIETGGDQASRAAMLAIARFYGVTLDYLESGADASSPPEGGQFVNDPDKLALLRFWDDLDDAERAVMLKMLRPRRDD